MAERSTNERYRGRDWARWKPRRVATGEARHPSTWERFKRPRYGWDKVRARTYTPCTSALCTRPMTRCPFHKFVASRRSCLLVRPGRIKCPFKWFGPCAKPGPTLSLLTARLTERCGPYQGLTRIRPTIWMSICVL